MLGVFARKSGVWAIVGIVTSVLAPLLSFGIVGIAYLIIF